MNERGAVPVEFAVGTALLLVPTLLLVLSVGPWLERQGIAESMAAEAARTLVLSIDPITGAQQAAGLVAQMAENGGIAPEDVELEFCPDAPSSCLDPQRGGTVSAAVSMRMPAVSIPGIGAVGSFWYTTTHEESVDQYRSLP